MTRKKLLEIIKEVNHLLIENNMPDEFCIVNTADKKIYAKVVYLIDKDKWNKDGMGELPINIEIFEVSEKYPLKIHCILWIFKDYITVRKVKWIFPYNYRINRNKL